MSSQELLASLATATGIAARVVRTTEVVFLVMAFDATRTPSLAAPCRELLSSKSLDKSSIRKIRKSSSGKTKANSTAAAPDSLLRPRERASRNRLMGRIGVYLAAESGYYAVEHGAQLTT